MGWYVVIKTIKGHRYRYRQRTRRENGRVRTESVYLGPESDGAKTATAKAKRAARSRKTTPAVNTTRREALNAGQFVIPVGSRRRPTASPVDRAQSKVDKVLKQRQQLVEKHAAGKFTLAQFMRHMTANTAQYLRAVSELDGDDHQ